VKLLNNDVGEELCVSDRTTIEKYFESHASQLKIEFDRIRQTLTDSSVKGGINEKIVGAFIERHYLSHFITYNSQVFDFKQRKSDELDICVCNEYQPFKSELLICEGVDFVVQVKAILSKSEIDRSQKNCNSVKQLERFFYAGDENTYAQISDLNELGKIPYIVFSFDADSSFETIHKNLVELSKSVDPFSQIDAVFCLGKGYSFINCRGGIREYSVREGCCFGSWFALETNESTLLEFVKYLYLNISHSIRRTHPLKAYLRGHNEYRYLGFEKPLNEVSKNI